MSGEVKTKKRYRDGAGYSVPGAAAEVGVSAKVLRTAIALQQVQTIEFGNLVRIPKKEVKRLKEVFGE
jgi:hypothetical protein